MAAQDGQDGGQFPMNEANTKPKRTQREEREAPGNVPGAVDGTRKTKNKPQKQWSAAARNRLVDLVIQLRRRCVAAPVMERRASRGT